LTSSRGPVATLYKKMKLAEKRMTRSGPNTSAKRMRSKPDQSLKSARRGQRQMQREVLPRSSAASHEEATSPFEVQPINPRAGLLDIVSQGSTYRKKRASQGLNSQPCSVPFLALYFSFLSPLFFVEVMLQYSLPIHFARVLFVKPKFS
jgi:hypothetical protein